MSVLTIAIPTYNRNKALANTIELLLPQLTPAVQVKVFDNCSDIAATDTLQQYSRSNISVVRNEINIGMSGNFLKCLEQCETEWLWVLSDDDLLAPDALETILHYISTYLDVVFIKFDSNLSGFEEYNTADVVSVGQEALIDNMKSFGNFLFVSSGVYRMASLKASIRNAYYFTATHAPHAALILDYTRAHAHSKTLYSKRSVVDWKDPLQDPKWSEALINKSVHDLVYLVANDRARSVLFSQMAVCHSYNHISGIDTIKSYVHADNKQRYNLTADYFASQSFINWSARSIRTSMFVSFIKISALMLLCENKYLNKIFKFIVTDSKCDRSIYNRFLYSVEDARL